MKRLIVTADDVGLDRGMTSGAIEAHRNGIVTACSLVANGLEFDDAVARLREVPSLEVGVHLALVEERALTTGKPMPKNWSRFLLWPPREVEPELRAQIEKVVTTGLRVTHLNGHQHLHMLPGIRRIVQRLAREYGIGYVRTVKDRGGDRRRIAISVLNRLGNGDRNTIGVAEAGHLSVDRLIALFEHVSGTTELVTHPGLGVTGYGHWKYDWETETRSLCDPRVREALARNGIELIAPSHV
ncbi:MAG TPA: ChbG/HpnK family deacetylase [Thermoanaerobaculia bacterium]|nr:ChbG/HpnK family deacetylase [Thermoanaerobaculia bacterium]